MHFSLGVRGSVCDLAEQSSRALKAELCMCAVLGLNESSANIHDLLIVTVNESSFRIYRLRSKDRIGFSFSV